MFKNINNILCIFLMLNLIGYIYAGSQDTCKGQLGHAGFIVHDDNEYPPNDLPYAYSAYDHLKNFIVQFKKKNKKMPMEYCESLDNK
ncbi:uncharacterized protein LOC107883948 isoform X3 [Acyrthosiphon pisum]|uniref:Uncharacterized protein n=1 Tax=Acyrthosiphon pisum TaxID=7029 RepID=A0A8R2D544_ACYPI|nr:uncharacterized protein LOC107883948 isoform X3 [Acyrthosiphon pisum]|eukprot:XP_016660530.1 PREDICTED: uncharacterized protein LOC107883948 isoform X6 [Acyrthosiphon pisum]